MVEQKLFGITFGVSVGFMSLITFMLYVDKTGLMLPTAIATFLHEWGHILILLAFRCKIEKISFRLGSVAVQGCYSLSTLKEALMLLAGPVANLLFFGVCYFALATTNNLIWLNYGLVSLVIAIINLLPIQGLDGGNLLLIFISQFLDLKNTDLVLKGVSFLACAVIILFGLYIFIFQRKNPSVIIFGIYLLIYTFKT